MRCSSLHRRLRRALPALASMCVSGALLADDVTGSDSLLCYGLTATRCGFSGTCVQAQPWELNLPDFLKLDLDAKRAVTTEASGELRETPIRTIERADGMILLQGVQGERAFSWLITEDTGEGTLTISSPAAGLTVFTVCTPIDKL
jgi:hypothetical protein